MQIYYGDEYWIISEEHYEEHKAWIMWFIERKYDLY